MALGIKGAAELLCFGKFLAWKIFVEVGGSIDGNVAAILVVRFLEAHVVVTQTKAIGYVAIQYGHSLLCDGPFLVGVRLHNVSLVDEKDDVESLLVVADPAGLLEEVAAQISVAPLLGKLESSVAVELGVGQDRNGKRFAGSTLELKILPIRRHRILGRQKLAERRE